MRTPKYLRCYDDGGETIDRFTIIFMRQRDGICRYVGSSSDPFSPNGFYQHGEDRYMIDKPSYKHLGKKIDFSALPEDVQRAVKQDYDGMWPNKTLAWLEQ